MLGAWDYVRVTTFLLAVLGCSAIHAQSQNLAVVPHEIEAEQLSVTQEQAAKSVADKLAREIQEVRKRNHLPPLHRSKASRQLLEETCTAAVTNKDFPSPNFSDGQFVRASDSTFSRHDQTIIDFDPTWKDLRRFEVAAWPTTNSPSERQVYWIGVRLHTGRAQEFLFQFITDDVEYLGQWKSHVAPACRGARW